MKTIIAIDPGSAGGIAWEHPGCKACCVRMPDTEGDLVELLRNITTAYDTPVVYLEDLLKHAGKDIPASTMAVYASNWGFIKGCVQYSGSPLHLVHPKSWQKQLGLGSAKGLTKTEWKNKLKAEAQRRYPHLKVTLSMADALLILAFAGEVRPTGELALS